MLPSIQTVSSWTFLVPFFLAAHDWASYSIHLEANFRHNFHSNISGVSATASILSIIEALLNPI